MCEIVIYISRGFFFSSFQNFDFSGCPGKGQKMAHKDKKFCPLCLISQEPYIIWSSFMAQLCKRIIYLGIFFYFFKILILWVIREGKSAKNDPQWQKILSVALSHLRKTSCDCDFWYKCVKWWYLQVLFSFFQNFDFSGC